MCLKTENYYLKIFVEICMSEKMYDIVVNILKFVRLTDVTSTQTILGHCYQTGLV